MGVLDELRPAGPGDEVFYAMGQVGTAMKRIRADLNAGARVFLLDLVTGERVRLVPAGIDSEVRERRLRMVGHGLRQFRRDVREGRART